MTKSLMMMCDDKRQGGHIHVYFNTSVSDHIYMYYVHTDFQRFSTRTKIFELKKLSLTLFNRLFEFILTFHCRQKKLKLVFSGPQQIPSLKKRILSLGCDLCLCLAKQEFVLFLPQEINC